MKQIVFPVNGKFLFIILDPTTAIYIPAKTRRTSLPIEDKASDYWPPAATKKSRLPVF